MEKYYDRIRRFYQDNPKKPKENLITIIKYLNDKLNQGLRTQTVITASENMLEISRWLDKPFKDLKQDDVNEFFSYLRNKTFISKGKEKHYSESSIHSIKIAFKTFLNWNGQKELADFKTKNPKSRKLPEDLLLTEEIETLINACQNPRDSALIVMLYESGARKGEIFSVKLKHVAFDENGAVITLPDGKTGARRIRLVFAASYLRNWIEYHPTKENRESYLFVSLHQPYVKLSSTGLYDQLARLAERTGVQKRINPHSFRHARATQLAKNLTEQQLKQYLGWTADSSMASVYVHLSGKDMDNAILKMNGIETEDTRVDGLKVGKCPRCKDLNPETSLYCGKCGYPLRDEGVRKLEEESDKFENEFMQLILKYPNLIENLAKYRKSD